MTCYCRVIFAKGLLSFKRQRGTYPHGPPIALWIAKSKRNKALRRRKPFYGNTVSSAESSSVWERSVASSQIACARTVADADV